MIRTAAIEKSEVNDTITGLPVHVSTSARVMFRKLNETWKRVPNHYLNDIIARQFSEAKHKSWFKPKKAPQDVMGEIRMSGSAQFIALDLGNNIAVIAVKGSPRINVPAPVSLPKQASRDDFQRSMRGFLENHSFDAVKDMYNLDHNSFDLLMRNLLKIDSDPIRALNRASKDKDLLGGMVYDILNKDTYRQINQEPPQRSGLLVVPIGRLL